MAINLNSFFNNPDNDNNPIKKLYFNLIDTNNDGKISDDEIKQLQEDDPLTYSSIFDAVSNMENENSFNEDNIIDNTNDTELSKNQPQDTDNNKNISVNLKDIAGIDFGAFSELSQGKNSDSGIPEFWNSLSQYDLNKLFDYIDTDKDNVLSNEELLKLSSIDGFDENLSLYDLQNFINTSEEDLTQNNVTNEETTDNDAITDKDENKINDKNSHQNKVKRSARGGKSTNYNDSTNHVVDTKTQYKNNLNKSKDVFNSAKTNYMNALDGNINDTDVQEKKEAMDNAYSAWQDELSKQDSSLSQNIDNAKTDLEDVKEQISLSEKDIFNNETNLAECQTTYDSAKSYRVGLENKKSELVSSLSDIDSSDEKNNNKIDAYKNQINSIEAEIKNAKREEERAKKAKEDAEKALKNSKDIKADLETDLKDKEEVLSKYIEDANILGSTNPVLSRLQQDYESKKDAYETALKDYKEKLKSDALSKHDDVINNQKQLSEYENNEKIESYNAILGEYDEDFASLINKYLLEGASDHSKSDCGGAVRRALYKAISERYGQNAASIFKEGYGVIGGDWDNQYLADSPLFTDITDLYSTSEIESMINNGELKGAIINYEKYSGSTSGHVEGITTKGLTSDYTRPHSYFRSKSSLGQAKYHVYIPRTASQKEINDYIQLMLSRKSSYKSPII